MFGEAKVHDDQKGPSVVPGLDEEDIETILAALAAGSARVERVQLKAHTVWIKRYRRQGPRLVQRLQWLVSRLTGKAFLRPSPLVGPKEAVDRELRQIAAFSAAGFTTPEVLYRGHAALVLLHLGSSVLKQMGALRGSDSNRFYRRHGFEPVAESEWDIDYLRPAPGRQA